MRNRATQPEQEEREREGGRIDQPREGDQIDQIDQLTDPNPISVKNKGKASMVSSTDASKISEKGKRKAPMSSTDTCADKVFDEHRLTKMRKLITEMDVEVTGISKNKSNSVIRKREWNLRCLSKYDMYRALMDEPQAQMEAICALYRQLANEDMNIRISDFNRAKIEIVVRFLTSGDMDGPCKKTAEELEELFKGSLGFCSFILNIYAHQLYFVYNAGSDPYFTKSQAGSITPALVPKRRDWSKASYDVSRLILEKVALAGYYYKSANVCKEWFTVAKDIHNPFQMGSFLILIPHNDQTDQGKVSVYELSSNKTFELTMQEVRGKFIHGTSKGWLGLSNNESMPSLLNLFTGARIELPKPKVAIKEINDRFAPDDRLKPLAKSFLMKKLVVSAEAAGGVVGSIMGEYNMLFFYRLGDESWTCVPFDSTLPFFRDTSDIVDDLMDLIFYEGILYAAGKDIILSIDIREQNYVSRKFQVPERYYNPTKKLVKVYLVNCCGSLLFVSKFPSVVPRNSSEIMETKGFQVHKLQEDGRTWGRIYHLGEYALLLGGNESVAVLASQISWCIPNSIYYVDDLSPGKGPGKEYQGDNGIFSLVDSKFEMLNISHSGPTGVSPSMWYQPTNSIGIN